MRQKIRRTAVALNALALLLAVAFYFSHTFNRIDKLLLDENIRQAAAHQPHESIIVVAIDDPSLQDLGRFPWDRSVYAPFLDMLNQPGYEPKAIAFDILFNEPSDPDSDAAFAEALSQYDNVILPVVGNTEGEVFGTIRIDPDEWPNVYNFIKPIPELAEHAHLANINRVISHDAAIRQTWLKLQTGDGEVIPSLAYKAVQLYGGDLGPFDAISDPNTDPGKQAARNTLTIDYQNVSEDFMTIGFSRVLNGEVDPSAFKDAIVLVGFTAAGLSDDSGQDTGVTPIEKNMKLVYVHANIIDQMLKGTSIRTLPQWAIAASGLLLFGLFVLLPWRVKNVYSILAFLAAIAGLFYGQYALYLQSKTILPVTDIVFALTLAYLINVSLKSYLESTQKNFVTRQFGRYISPDLVKQIVAQDIDIKLGGDSKNITILFLDIRGFTPLSEKLTPPELVDTLNTMFNMITETALRNRGTIDKFIGDAAMILFNAPLDVDHHPLMAVKTAYEIQQQMREVRDRILEKYGVEVNVGIGIHTGDVVIGNIGSYLRVDYTAIGDNVNIAARIESQTKKGQILVSEQVYELTKDHFQFDEGEDRMFKGKSHPIRVYEVLGTRRENQHAMEEAAASKDG